MPVKLTARAADVLTLVFNGQDSTVIVLTAYLATGMEQHGVNASSAPKQYGALNRATKAEFHHSVASGLIRFIMSSGDGKA